MDDEYFKDSPATPQGQDLTWIEWFYQELNVEKVVYMGENELSSDGDYLRRHRPDRFLNCFRLWAQGRKANSVQYLKNIEVLCGEDGATELVPFQSAYFPTETLKGRVDRFLPPDSFTLFGRRLRFGHAQLLHGCKDRQHDHECFRKSQDIRAVRAHLDRVSRRKGGADESGKRSRPNSVHL